MTTQEELVKAWVDSYLSRDLNNLKGQLSDDSTYETFPGAAELPKKTSSQDYIAKYRPMFSLFTNLEIHTHEMIEASGIVVLHITAKGTITGRNTPVEYESLTILTIVKTNQIHKITKVKDYCDPEKRANFYGCAARGLI